MPLNTDLYLCFWAQGIKTEVNTVDMKQIINQMLESYNDLLTYEEVRSILHVGRNYVYKKAKSGELPNLKFGNKVYIPKKILIEYMLVHSR